MGRVGIRDENLRILTIRENASVVGRSRGPDEPRQKHGENQSHSYRRRRSRSPETLPRLGDERERTCSGSDQRDHRFERRIGMACIDDEIRAEYSATSTESHERNLQRESLLPQSFTAYEIALGEWKENIHKWESTSGDRFNMSMKRAIFFDRAPSTARIPLRMQNLDAFEAMTAVTLQFLQHSAQYQAGVTVSPKGPDDMEIDAFTKKGKIHKGKEKSKTDRQK